MPRHASPSPAAIGSASDPDATVRVDVRLREAIEDGTLPPELLIAGPAGTGKTFGYLRVLHTIARDYPGLRILFGRETRAALTDSVMQQFDDEILPADDCEHVTGAVSPVYRRQYFYPESGSFIRVAGLDKWERLKSTKWDIVFINEATTIGEDTWQGISSRLDRPGTNPDFGWLLADCNPADPMHWLKRRCDDGRTVLWETTHEANPALYSHKRGRWTRAGRKYLARLDRLTGTAYQRLRLGLWAAGEGTWFAAYDDRLDATPDAAFRPGQGPVTLAIDCNGKHIGAVWFQVRGDRNDPTLCVFGDYYDDDPAKHAAIHARAILARSHALCGHQVAAVVGDPSGNSHSGVNTTVGAEYRKAGLPFIPWPRRPGSVLDGIQLIETFLGGNLKVHPGALATRTALLNFRRRMVNKQYVDEPEDPQHPHEDLIEALRGGLLHRWPDGRNLAVRGQALRRNDLP